MSPNRSSALSSTLLLLLPLFPLPTQASNKRGLAYSSAALANLFQNYPINSWAYNWGYPSNGLSSNLEFTPMLWGDPTNNAQYSTSWTSAAQAAISSASSHAQQAHLLSFNEPDLNNLSPAQAAASYLKNMQPFAGKAKLGAPAVTNGGPPTGFTWLQQFLGNCSACTIDFVPIHWYGGYDQIGYFADYMKTAHAIAGPARPVWLTEFQALGGPNVNGGQQGEVQFLRTVLPWLESLDWLQRYAYFGVFEGYMVDASGKRASPVGNEWVFDTKVNGTVPTSLVAN